MRISLPALLASLTFVSAAVGMGYVWDTRRDSSQAAELYANECASCHGNALEGQHGWRLAVFDSRTAAPPLNGTGHSSHHSDHMLLRTMRQAARPGFGHAGPSLEGEYSDKEFRELLEWIKSHWPERERRYQKDLNTWISDKPGPR